MESPDVGLAVTIVTAATTRNSPKPIFSGASEAELRVLAPILAPIIDPDASATAQSHLTSPDITYGAAPKNAITIIAYRAIACDIF